MNHEDEHKRLLSSREDFNKNIEATKNNRTAAKLMENLIPKKDLNQKKTINSSNFYAKRNMWNILVNNSMISRSIFDNTEIPKRIIELQKVNSSFFKLLNNEDFIEEFRIKYKRILDGDETLQESNINVFGEKIVDEIKIKPDSSQGNDDHDPKKLLNGIVYLLFIIFCMYVQNLDQFNDFEEAMVFYINSIECKGVTISRVNLRMEPNFSSEALLTIPKNSLLIIYDDSQNGWVKVKVNLNNIDVDGYISEAYIRKLKQ